MSNLVNTLSVTSPNIWLPKTIDEAAELKNQFGKAAEFASGATLLQLQWKNGRKVPDHLISLENIDAIRAIKFNQENAELSIGALTSLGVYQTNKIIKGFPIICNALKSIAAPGIRNRGTIGGNVMGGVGDIIPLLLSLNAKLEFWDANNLIRLDIWSWLQQTSNKEKLLTRIIIPLDKEIMENYSFYRKIGRRETFTAAILTVSGKIKWDETNKIVDATLAIGGGDNQPIRLEITEQLIIGNNGYEVDWKKVYDSIIEEFIPAEDTFVTGSYRKKVAANLIVAEIQGQFIKNGFAKE